MGSFPPRVGLTRLKRAKTAVLRAAVFLDRSSFLMKKVTIISARPKCRVGDIRTSYPKSVHGKRRNVTAVTVSEFSV
jgi:hypothetical protein